MTEAARSYPESVEAKAVDFCGWLYGYLGHGPAVTIGDYQISYIRSQLAALIKDIDGRGPVAQVAQPEDRLSLMREAFRAGQNASGVAQSVWQPIETCPKAEGALYFLFNELWEIEGWKNVERAEWFQGAWLFESGLMLADCDAKFNPTMWHPDTTPAEPTASTLSSTHHSAPAMEGELDTVVQLIHKHVDVRDLFDGAQELIGVEDAAKAILSALSSTDPRCTCAAIVNPDIPHARSCPLSSTHGDGK